MNFKAASLRHEFFHYVFNSVLGNVGLTAYFLADTIFIARGVGVNGLTSLNLALPIYSVIYGCGFMFATGCAVQYSVLTAQKEEKQANSIFTEGCLYCLILSIVFALIGFFFAGQIALFMGASDEVFADTTTYIRTISLFSPFFIFNNLLTCMIRNDGGPKLVMISQLIGTFFNIIFDYIFIFPMGMGMFGAALATCFSPLVSILIMSRFFLTGQNHFHFRKLRKAGEMIRNLFRTMYLGLSSFVNEMATGLVIFFFNQVLLNLGGDTAVAAYGITANLTTIVICIFNGIGQGFQPLISRYYGEGERARIQKIFRYGIWTSVITGVVIVAVIFLWTSPIILIFIEERDALLEAMAENALRLYSLSYLFASFNLCCVYYLAALERARDSFILSLCRGLILVVPLLYLFSSLWGIDGVWLTSPGAELLTTVIAVVMIAVTKRHLASSLGHGTAG